MTPHMTAIPDGWLSLEETTERLGRSQRTIQKMVQGGQLQSKKLPREGRAPEAVYWAQDVERIESNGIPRKQAKARAAAAGTLEAGELAARPAVGGGRKRPGQEERALDTLVMAVGQMAAAWWEERDGERERRRADQENEQKRLAAEADRQARPWITLEEGALCGLPPAALRRLGKEGKIVVSRVGGFRILRASLEAYTGV